MATAVTAPLEFQIRADASQFRAALEQAQQSHRRAADGMTRTFEDATKRAGIVINVFLEKVAQVTETVGRSIGEAAEKTSDMWQAATQGAFNAVNPMVRDMITSTLGMIGGAGGRMAVAAYGMFAAPVESALDSAKRSFATWLLENESSLAATRSRIMSWIDSLPGSAGRRYLRDRAAVQGDMAGPGQLPGGISEGLEAAARSGPINSMLEALARTAREADQAEQEAEIRLEHLGSAANQAAGEVARLRAEFAMLAAVGGRQDLNVHEITAIVAAMATAFEGGNDRDAAQRRLREATQLSDAITSVTTALQRQIDAERNAANAIRQTAVERARARGEMLARGHGRRGVGDDLLADPGVRAKIEEEAREAGISARIRLNNEMTTTVEQQTRGYMLQIDVLGQTAARTAALTFENQQLLAAQRAGVPVTDELREAIRRQSEGLAQAAQSAAVAQDRWRAFQDLGRTVTNSLEGAFSKLMDGTGFKWKQFIHGLMQDLAKLAFRQSLMPIFGGGQANPGGMFGSLFSSIFGGFRAGGGDVSTSKAYMVGERGPELFVPKSAGTIVPNMGGGGGNSTIKMTINLEGANGDETIARMSAQAARMGAQMAVQQMNVGMPARQRQYQLLGA